MRRLPLVVTAFAVTACASGSGGSSSTVATPSATGSGTAVAGRTYTTTLQAQNASGDRVTGTVKLTPTAPGEFRAEVSIRNAGGMQKQYPWRIRTGQCGQIGAAQEVGNPVAYRMLETASDGSARVSAPLKVDLAPNDVYHVDILRSPTDRETVVACGILSVS